VSVGLFLVSLILFPFVRAQVGQCFDVKFRGVVTNGPDFGGAVGVWGVNIIVQTILLGQSSDLREGDVVTVFWPVVPRFLNISAKIGDEVEVYGSCCKDSMPSWWSHTGQYWSVYQETTITCVPLSILMPLHHGGSGQ
jgi:hypothetical protein